MKILFKYKHWIVMQGIYMFIGVLTGIMYKTSGRIGGGLTVGFHFISNTQELLIPIFSLILADLAFNIEYVEGTFLTHLLTGLDRKRWFFKRLMVFYGFLIIQFFIAFLVISIGAGIITGEFGVSGVEIPSDVGTGKLILDTIKSTGANIVKMIVYVSLAVLISTCFPGKLLLGSVLSLGILFVSMRVTNLFYVKFNENKLVNILADILYLTDPNKGMLYGIMWLVLFTFVSLKKIDKITISNQGI